MITIDKLKKNFGEKVAVDIEHYEINQGDIRKPTMQRRLPVLFRW